MITDNETTTLEACPFCGDELMEVAGNEWEEDFRVTCIGCLSASGRWRTKSEAITAWNRRVSAASTAPVVDQAEPRKWVYSKDVMDALQNTFAALKGQRMPTSELAIAVYRGLSAVPEFAAAAFPAAPVQSVVNFEAWTSIDQWLRDNPAATGAECLAELVRRIKVEAPAAPQEDALVDEVQHRVDQVVEAAVEWHQAGREGGEWLNAAEKLSAAINSLLELRDEPGKMPRRWCSVHNREEFKYESLEHELDVQTARAFEAKRKSENKDNPAAAPDSTST